VSTSTSSVAEPRLAPRPLEVEVEPPWPYVLPRFGGEDGVMRVRDGVASRLLRVEGRPVLVRAWHRDRRRVALRAEALAPEAVELPPPGGGMPGEARPVDLEIAVARMRFALGVDEDLAGFYRQFRADRLLGPLIRRRPHLRPPRRPWAWEAVAWAIAKQLIETGRAARIQRRIVGRWGMRLERSPGTRLRDVPPAELIAGRAPAELEALDLSPARSVAMVAVARLVAGGRVSPEDPGSDARLLSVPEIGPWTVQCLGLLGRGEPDSLPAGDLMYLKLVGRLARLRRRATVEEVEEFFAPYRPFRGLAAFWMHAL
jgi:3-methyladenine DNA glycosylase/8-oxoguanine DNA glycosylase